MDDLFAYLGLFASAFVAATVFPAQSEALMVALQLSGRSVAALVAIASIGNTLGAVVNWFLGRGIQRFQNRSWFPATPGQLEAASRWYHRWGRWSLLLSWAPIVGDALTVVAGVLREPLWSFLAIVALAKTGRFIVLAIVTAQVTA